MMEELTVEAVNGGDNELHLTLSDVPELMQISSVSKTTKKQSITADQQMMLRHPHYDSMYL